MNNNFSQNYSERTLGQSGNTYVSFCQFFHLHLYIHILLLICWPVPASPLFVSVYLLDHFLVPQIILHNLSENLRHSIIMGFLGPYTISVNGDCIAYMPDQRDLWFLTFFFKDASSFPPCSSQFFTTTLFSWTQFPWTSVFPDPSGSQYLLLLGSPLTITYKQ